MEPCNSSICAILSSGLVKRILEDRRLFYRIKVLEEIYSFVLSRSLELAFNAERLYRRGNLLSTLTRKTNMITSSLSLSLTLSFSLSLYLSIYLSIYLCLSKAKHMHTHRLVIFPKFCLSHHLYRYKLRQNMIC